MNAAKAVSKEVAKQEVDKWLDFKRVKARKRKSNEDSIETMIESFEDGTLILDEKTHEIKLKLEWEVGGKKELIFQPRLKMIDIHSRLKQTKNADERIMAYICALTGQNTGVIGQCDPEDYSIAQTIAIFFF